MKIKPAFILFFLLLTISLRAQIVTNTSSDLVSGNRNNFTPEEIAEMQAKGINPSSAMVIQPQTNQVTLSPTPLDLTNAIVCLDSFLGMTNAMLPVDVISMKPASLKFRLNGQDYDYSGNYTVMLNIPRQHKNSYFGFGSPDTAKLVILENFGGNVWPLKNATIWEKKANYIDMLALDKEWIYSGTYTVQN